VAAAGCKWEGGAAPRKAERVCQKKRGEINFLLKRDTSGPLKIWTEKEDQRASRHRTKAEARSTLTPISANHPINGRGETN